MDNRKIIAQRENKTVYFCDGMLIKEFTPGCRKVDVLNEVNNQVIIEDLKIPVPKIVEVSLKNHERIVKSEFAEGETLENLMKKNPEKEDEYLKMFVDLQDYYQKKQTKLLTRQGDKLNDQITQSDLPASIRYSLHMKLETMQKKNEICHGDFNPSNVVITKDGSAVILDWSKATRGMAEGDAATTYVLFILDGKIELAEKYLLLYCEKTHREESEIKRFVPIVCASHSIECPKEKKALLLEMVYQTRF